MRRIKVSLGLSGMSAPELIEFALHIVTKMTGNAFFPTPSPSLGNLYNAAIALQSAFDQAQGGGTQQTAVMHQKREALETMLTAEGHYAEDIANDPLNAAAGAEAIILSAGMIAKRFSPHQKRVFTVDRGELSGTVVLTAEHAKRGFHEWQYSLDASKPDGWVDAASTLKASISISGLESTKQYFFRHRLVLKEGPGAWDGPISIVVL